jgi:hypothetical protein
VHEDVAQLVLAQAAAQVAQLAADVMALRQRIAAHVVDAGCCTL